MCISLVPQPKSIKMLEGHAAYDTQCDRIIDVQMQPQAYVLKILPERIEIRAGSPQGLKYGETTLKQLCFCGGGQYPCLVIEDCPAFEWRSFHMDCARHFMPLDELKKMVHMASFFKFNRFHWHISDDQGWRIESERYPKLHQIGSRRQGDHFGDYDSDAWEGGYYTKAQVRELVAYCDSLGIQIVPEIDMPGHVSAILAAYPELGCNGAPVSVGTKAGIYWDILCAGKESTFEFIENLLVELLELFPGDTFHIGGDEAPKAHWKDCPHCRRRMEALGLENVGQLQGYMANRIAKFLKEKGRRAIAWNEASYGGNLDRDIVLQLWTEDKSGKVREHLKGGGQVILSEMLHSYCDYPYAFISLKSVYDADLASAALAGGGIGNIIGTECLAWSEYIRDVKTLEGLCWPRYAASAEVGWCGNDRPGYDSFAGRLENLFPAFALYGIEATQPDGWIPSEPEALKQLAAFQKNFPKEVMEGFAKAQEEV